MDGVSDVVANLNPIAHPLAERKLQKKLFKTIRKASKEKHVKRGVKEVEKALKKGAKGLVILAGDIYPIDIYCHLPICAEEAGNPYVFVPNKESLGEAAGTKRATSCVMIVPGDSARYSEDYETIHKEAQTLVEKLILNLA
ncbi:L30e-like protein [Meira miltonrushii]|uniref:H/ACA ribonucleoprotein complex subunit 2 n=1 Tax=Meira miltonrushii TaxID=1280837 RepID=A0A316VID3_9BASI|nr:L30e-like protein [Meira miltonrushii]PWN37417.1 L30e-like protein [Meira miltonrushii]